ncbi:hypothetical protein CEP88_17440 [Roseobacter denitrificans]|uniref:SoxS n=1 Tax=Roseobacter denitrificans (strain ATCC 33942 / OCh 114) TaxID=375451 RepID=Q16A52_ROSDO|nr:hypothetical protein [Roseobacter denitrificans]ABG31141.1 SoxS [Roseobacter denitrificans OCh 114]AVL54207.1 hypothetical protein CEP88_17440 [Roseobacter denitrificans]SFG32356.1 hypothetical protein SAMN05443635_11331 [Roseobacter denitrificans OCh 114]
MFLRALLFSSLLVLAGTYPVLADTRLVMVEEKGCIWCARWNEEIADIYPKTGEGKAAPLQRMDIHAPRPERLSFARALHYTPTFVLMVDGVEVSRIEGYPGEDFFWGLLAQMLVNANIAILE